MMYVMEPPMMTTLAYSVSLPAVALVIATFAAACGLA